MKVNKKINYIKYALAAVWCAWFLLLGGCSETEESTWKQEYENCMTAMEQGIAERGEAGQQELIDLLGVCPEMDRGTWEQEYVICMTAMEREISEFTSISFRPYESLEGSDKEETDSSKELWQDSPSAFDECVEACTRNQAGDMEGAEETYRMAVLLMKTLCESRNGHYKLAHTHGEDPEKAQEDFRAVLEREPPIDESS